MGPLIHPTLDSFYPHADGLDLPRNSSINGASLPNPRYISTNIFTDQFKSEKIWLHFFTVIRKIAELEII